MYTAISFAGEDRRQEPIQNILQLRDVFLCKQREPGLGYESKHNTQIQGSFF